MHPPPARRTGRPPKTSREQILDAAALYDQGQLQLTSLAASLGISVKTVYYYFPNRRALLEALTTRAVLELGTPDYASCATPRDVLVQVGWWAYRLAEQQPDWYFDTAAPQGALLRSWRAALDALNALGVDDAEGVVAFAVVSDYSFAAGRAANRTRAAGGLSDDTVHGFLDDLTDEATASRMAGLLAGVDLHDWFERGLGVVLSGVEHELLGGSS